MSSHRSSTTRSTALPSSKKTHSEQHKQIFRQLLKEPGNKTCVDCKTATHPRWASWNLGCFICIRCSGIHRSMGTHISKVKSVDLDAWTDEQVESMVKWGNDKCNSYWEAKLPEGYVPDQLKIENFIRTKYDLKKWVGSSTIPNPMSIAVATPSEIKPDLFSNDSSFSSINKAPAKPAAPASNSINLLDDEFGAFTQSSTNLPATNTNKSHPPVPKKESPKNQLPSLPTQQVPQSAGGSLNNLNKNGRNDLKKSILSLYSSPSSSSSSFIQPQNNQPRVVANPSPVHSLSSSLNVLNFGNSTFSSPVVKTSSSAGATPNSTTPKATAVPTTSWNNEWADNSTSSVNSSTMGGNWNSFGTKPTSTSLDDDLFKNVWN